MVRGVCHIKRQAIGSREGWYSHLVIVTEVKQRLLRPVNFQVVKGDLRRKRLENRLIKPNFTADLQQSTLSQDLLCATQPVHN